MRCPIDQAEQLYAALKYQRKPVKFVRYPGEFHGMSRTGKPWHRVHRLRMIAEWFAEYRRRYRPPTGRLRSGSCSVAVCGSGRNSQYRVKATSEVAPLMLWVYATLALRHRFFAKSVAPTLAQGDSGEQCDLTPAEAGSTAPLRRVWLQSTCSFPGASDHPPPSPRHSPVFSRQSPVIPPSFPRGRSLAKSDEFHPAPTSSRWTPQRRNEIPAAADGVPLTFPPAPISAWASTGSWRKTTTAKTRNSCESTPEWRPCRPQNCAKRPLPRSLPLRPASKQPQWRAVPVKSACFLAAGGARQRLCLVYLQLLCEFSRRFQTIPPPSHRHPPVIPPPSPAFPREATLAKSETSSIRALQPTPDGLPSVGQHPAAANRVPLTFPPRHRCLRGRQLDQAARP